MSSTQPANPPAPLVSTPTSVFSAASRRTFITGAILAALAVGLGAIGAHGLQDHTDARGLATWETGVRYQVMHSLALLLFAMAAPRYSPGAYRAITLCFLVGMAIFSGTLYILVLSGIKWLGAITPIGGVLLIIGWLIAAATHRPASAPPTG